MHKSDDLPFVQCVETFQVGVQSPVVRYLALVLHCISFLAHGRDCLVLVMHDQVGSPQEEASLQLSRAKDQLAVGDASSALHSLVQALRYLGISPQAQQAAVCQCVTAPASRPCSRNFCG